MELSADAGLYEHADPIHPPRWNKEDRPYPLPASDNGNRTYVDMMDPGPDSPEEPLDN